MPRYYETLLLYLEENLWAFSFADRPNPEEGGILPLAAEGEGVG